MARAKKKAKKKAKPKVKRKKTTVKRAIPRTKPAARKVVRKPKIEKKPASSPPPALPGERIGIVTHYYGHLSVAVVKLEAGARLRVGDNIHIKGHSSDFGQRVDSLQVGHAPVDEVGPNADFGLKVVEHAREHDVVYKVGPA